MLSLVCYSSRARFHIFCCFVLSIITAIVLVGISIVSNIMVLTADCPTGGDEQLWRGGAFEAGHCSLPELISRNQCALH